VGITLQKAEYGDGMIDRLPGLAGVGRWARVAAAGRVAGLAWLRGDAAGCQAALDRQRGLARGHPASEVTAFTSSALLTAASGDLGRAREDLAEAEIRLHAVGIAALAPQWEQAALVCDWAAGDQDAARARTARMEEMPPPVPAAVTLSLRVEVLRRSGRTDAARRVADRLAAASPAALSAWALAGLEREPAAALTRLRTATAAAFRDGHEGLVPLLLHRTAKIAFAADEPEAVAWARTGFLRLAGDGPLTRVLAGLTEARATRSVAAARRAESLAASAGLGLLVADCQEVRSRLGDDRGGASSSGPRPHLTVRERELAGLVRTGRTNRQIAAAMHLSVKSVEAYLTRVYAKTGCASRLELALALAEGRLDGA
jgi:DNA-binding CsgD family transcriptional regulator